MKKKRYPKGYKSPEEFQQRWMEVMFIFDNSCSHCHKQLKEPIDAIPLKMKYMSEEVSHTLEDFGGLFIPILLIQDKRVISAMCPGEDSPAKKDGFDLIFLVCEDCKSELRELLEKYFSGDLAMQVGFPGIERPIEEWFEKVDAKGIIETAEMMTLLQPSEDKDKKGH